MRVLRYDVPADGAEHVIGCGTGKIVHVDCRDPEIVTFWIVKHYDEISERTFRVFATGEVLPGDRWEHVGTGLSPDMSPFMLRGRLVWHLFEQVRF